MFLSSVLRLLPGFYPRFSGSGQVSVFGSQALARFLSSVLRLWPGFCPRFSGSGQVSVLSSQTLAPFLLLVHHFCVICDSGIELLPPALVNW